MDIEGPHRRDARATEVRSFALAVCANLIKRLRRARARRSEVHAQLAVEAPDAVDNLERTIVHRELAERLARSLEELPEAQRTTLLLSALEEHSAADIARMTGVPEATVRTRLFHARRKLRSALEPSRVRRGLLVAAGVVVVVALLAFAPRAMAAPFVAAYHAVLRAIGLEVRSRAEVAPRAPAPPVQSPPHAAPAKPDEQKTPASGAAPPARPPSLHIAASARRREPALPDPLRAEYRSAHQAQFIAHDYDAAVRAWDRYLGHASSGPFALEARYNRAIALAHLGHIDEARAALAPFAAGDYGVYRRHAAERLLEGVPAH
jgi:RNA polymerase sigma factor (sigma-70 family)